MTSERSGPPDSVPTLTEEVSLPGALAGSLPEAQAEPESRQDPESRRDSTLPAAQAEPGLPPPPQATPEIVAVVPTAPRPAALNEDQLTRNILVDLQRQVDLVLEYRLREVLTPILARATDAVVRDARNELTRTLREVVARSVAEELLRQRSR